MFRPFNDGLKFLAQLDGGVPGIVAEGSRLDLSERRDGLPVWRWLGSTVF